MSQITIRAAHEDEAGELTALCFRSKAHWGYDETFMALSRVSLTISPELIASGRVEVAQNPRGVIVGMASIAKLPQADSYDLLHLFVDPSAIGSGTGRALFGVAAAMAKERGARLLVIQSDPNAAWFYRRVGARDAGDAPSESIPGRRLPVLHYALN